MCVCTCGDRAFGMLYESTGREVIPLSTTAQAVGGLASAVITLAEGRRRRIRVTVAGEFVPATKAAGRYAIQIGHNAGTSPQIDRAVMLGAPIYARTAKARTVGVVGRATTEPLPAGTYTFYAVPQRAAGGSAEDVAATTYFLVEDVGTV